MNDIISKAALEARKARFKPGCRVELVSMDDPYTNLKPGDQGWVDFVDDIGSVFIRWDNGSTLAAAYGADEIMLLPTPMTDAVRDQILEIRASGATNMFDATTVQHIAIMRGFYDLADYIESDKTAYSQFILTGKRSKLQNPSDFPTE